MLMNSGFRMCRQLRLTCIYFVCFVVRRSLKCVFCTRNMHVFPWQCNKNNIYNNNNNSYDEADSQQVCKMKANCNNFVYIIPQSRPEKTRVL